MLLYKFSRFSQVSLMEVSPLRIKHDPIVMKFHRGHRIARTAPRKFP